MVFFYLLEHTTMPQISLTDKHVSFEHTITLSIELGFSVSEMKSRLTKPRCLLETSSRRGDVEVDHKYVDVHV